MKIAVFVMAIMVMCICRGSISEEKQIDSKPRHGNCRFPKGNHGSVRTDECIKNICSHGKWRPKLRTDICCYKQQVHKPNTVLETIVSADNCSSTTIGCGAVAQLEFTHKNCAATKQQVEKLEMNLEHQVEEVVDKIENVTEASDKQADEIYKKVEKKIQEIENSIEINSDDLSDKVNNVAQKIENNKISFASHVNDLSDQMVGKIQTLENKMDDLSNQVSRKFENQTERIQELTKNQAEKIQELTTNQADKIQELTKKQAEKIQELTKNQTEKIEDLTNDMESLTQMVKDNIKDQNEMSLQMMRTLFNLTQLMEKHSEDTPMVEGVLITGGTGALKSTELFLPHTGKTCSLQSLPDNRQYHSLNVVSNKIILCGGDSTKTKTSCLQFLPTSSTGSWAYYATLAPGRWSHTTHSFQEDLLLMGGLGGDKTAEIIGKGTQFNLQQSTAYACSIPDESSTILTGGSGSVYYKTVVRYNMKGFVENLPDMATARRFHGCGSYMDNENNKVLVVAGGWNGAYLSSTELLPAGATTWQSGESLPRAMNNAASVNMGSYFLLIGGYRGGYRKEFLKFNGSWTEVGRMKTARCAFGASNIKMNIDDQLDITACY